MAYWIMAARALLVGMWVGLVASLLSDWKGEKDDAESTTP